MRRHAYVSREGRTRRPRSVVGGLPAALRRSRPRRGRRRLGPRGASGAGPGAAAPPACRRRRPAGHHRSSAARAHDRLAAERLQLEEQHRRRQRAQRSHDQPQDQVADRKAHERVGDAVRQRLDHRADDDLDQEEDHDHPEHPPAVAADQLAAAAEGLERTRALDHDHRCDHGPDGEQEEARHDQQDQADPDAEAGEEARDEQRRDHGRRRLDERPDRVVAAPVEDVPRGLHHHPLEPVGRDRPDDRDDREAEEGHAARVDDSVDDRDRDEHQQRGRNQQRELVSVDLEDALEDPSGVELLVHARESIATCGPAGRDPAATSPTPAARRLRRLGRGR